MIEIKYDGKYPCTCMGTLTIIKDGIEIYQEKYCCHSTGSVWFDDDWNDHVESGELIWIENEAKQYSEEVQKSVADKLSKYFVCCGGCI